MSPAEAYADLPDIIKRAHTEAVWTAMSPEQRAMFLSPRYMALPRAVRDEYDYMDWCWLSDQTKNALERSCGEPDELRV